MPMLALNGLTIPIAADALHVTYDEQARITRQLSGQLSRDVLHCKRRWELTTSPMTWELAQQLRSWILAPSWAWSFAQAEVRTNVRSYDSQVANWLYASAVAGDGFGVLNQSKFGDFAGVPAGLAENLWPSNVANGTEDGTTGGFVPIGLAQLESATDAFWQGSRSLRMVATAPGDGAQTAPVTLEMERYFVSFYMRASVPGLTILVEVESNGSIAGSQSFVASSVDWQRCGLFFTAEAGDAVLRITAPGGSGWFCFDGLQLEVGARTPWVQGSRALQTQAMYELSPGQLASPYGISIAAWVTPAWKEGARIFVGSRYGTSQRIQLMAGEPGTGDTLQLYVNEPAGNVRWLGTSGFDWPSDDGWAHVIGIVRPSAHSGNAPTMELYINGEQSSLSYQTVQSDPSLMTHCWIGQDEDGTNHWNGPLDQVAVLPYPLSQSGARALYAATSPSQAARWPLMRASGEMLPEGGAVDVLAMITGMTAVQAHLPTGEFTANLVEVSLTLEEC